VLTERQRLYLATIFDADQAAEADIKARSARWEKTPPGQLQALGPRPRGQLPHQLLVHTVARLGRHIHRHNSHKCLFRLRSYTVELTVPGQCPNQAAQPQGGR
jgi:hypothetical protein